jgi:hypothetical protein
MAWTSQGYIPEEAMSSARLKNAQTGSAAHPVSHVLSTGGFFPREYAISYLGLVRRLRLSGDIPLFLPYLTSGCTQGQLQLLSPISIQALPTCTLSKQQICATEQTFVQFASSPCQQNTNGLKVF